MCAPRRAIRQSQQNIRTDGAPLNLLRSGLLKLTVLKLLEQLEDTVEHSGGPRARVGHEEQNSPRGVLEDTSRCTRSPFVISQVGPWLLGGNDPGSILSLGLICSGGLRDPSPLSALADNTVRIRQPLGSRPKITGSAEPSGHSARGGPRAACTAVLMLGARGRGTVYPGHGVPWVPCGMGWAAKGRHGAHGHHHHHRPCTV